MTAAPFCVTALDHFVLTVQDIERTVHFYTSVLGMEARTFGQGRVALHCGAQKINLHAAGHVIDPNVRHATPGSADICFLTQAPISSVVEALSGRGVRIIEGPVRRTGAQGPITSVYVYDPDENLVEIAVIERSDP